MVSALPAPTLHTLFFLGEHARIGAVGSHLTSSNATTKVPSSQLTALPCSCRKEVPAAAAAEHLHSTHSDIRRDLTGLYLLK